MELFVLHGRGGINASTSLAAACSRLFARGSANTARGGWALCIHALASSVKGCRRQAGFLLSCAPTNGRGAQLSTSQWFLSTRGLLMVEKSAFLGGRCGSWPYLYDCLYDNISTFAGEGPWIVYTKSFCTMCKAHV